MINSQNSSLFETPAPQTPVLNSEFLYRETLENEQFLIDFLDKVCARESQDFC